MGLRVVVGRSTTLGREGGIGGSRMDLLGRP